MTSRNNRSDKNNSSKRTSSSAQRNGQPSDDAPELIGLSDDDDDADVNAARHFWRQSRRPPPSERPPATVTSASANASRRSGTYDVTDNDDGPPPLDDDDDFHEIAPVAAAVRTGSHRPRSVPASRRSPGRVNPGYEARNAADPNLYMWSRDSAASAGSDNSNFVLPMFGPRPTHYCHQCRRSVSIDPSAASIECPDCHGSFIEEISSQAFEMEQNQRGPRVGGDDDDDAEGGGEEGMVNIANVLSNLMGGVMRVSRTSSGGPSSSTIRVRTPAGAGSRRVVHLGGTTAGGSGGGHAPQVQMEFNGEMDIAQFMQQIIGAMGGQAAAPGNVFGGDYVFSNEGFDQVMSQLLEQLGGMGGVPPLSKDALDTIPTSKPPQAALDADENCIICFEQYQPDDECKKLPCEHYFHVACISKWLQMHGTCPICRDDLSKKFPESVRSAQTNADGSNSASAEASSVNYATMPGRSHASTAGGATPFANFQFQPFASAVFVSDANGNLVRQSPFSAAAAPSSTSSSAAPGSTFLSGDMPNDNNNNAASQQRNLSSGEASPASPIMRFFRTIRDAVTGESSHASQTSDNNNNHAPSTHRRSPPATSAAPQPYRSPDVAGVQNNSGASPVIDEVRQQRPEDARRRAAEAAVARAGQSSSSTSSSSRAEGSSFATSDAEATASASSSDGAAQSGKRHKPGDGSGGGGVGNDGKKLQYDELD